MPPISTQKISKRTVHLWNRANIPEIKEELSEEINHFCILNQDNQSAINDQWTQLKTIFNSALEKIPSKTLSQRYSQVWINRECKRLSRRKKHLYRRAKRTNLQSDWERFKHSVKECKKACRSAHDKHLQEKIIDSNNTKKFYKYIKSKNTDNISVAPLKRGETYVVDDKEKANILNNQYCSVFSEPHKDTPQINSPQAESTIEDIVIQQIGVLNLLNKLDPSKATGPDKISARFLKEFSSEIAPALTLFFGNSLSQGNLPSEWRHAFIVPVYKGNIKERSSPESYRPLSLTSVCCKVMEPIIYSSIMKHLNDNNILSDEQHGFRNNRSCESQLLITINDFATRLNDKEQIDSIIA